MDYFYGSNEELLLTLSVTRFWGKYKNMQVIKLQNKLEMISTFNIAQSPEGQNTVNNLNWRLDELKGIERTDGLKDLKIQFGKKKKVKTNG